MDLVIHILGGRNPPSNDHEDTVNRYDAMGCAILIAMPLVAHAQSACNFNDYYWAADCPTQGFNAGCYRWHLLDEDAPYADIRVCPVWDLGYTGAGFTIGIVDFGVRISHEDLWDRYNEEASLPHCANSSVFCFAHGTAMAGLAVASADNSAGIVGVAHGAMFAELRLECPCDLVGTIEQLADALAFRNDLNDLKLASIGFGNAEIDYMLCEDLAPCIRDTIEDAATVERNGLGTIIVISAGNQGHVQGRSDYNLAKSHRYCILVGATDHLDTHACYTDPGSCVFLVAPGGEPAGLCDNPSNSPPWQLWTTQYTADDAYSAWSGTSFSGPIVGGVTALMLEADVAVHGIESLTAR